MIDDRMPEGGLVEQLRERQRKIDALPPAPRCFMAHHSVPYGRVFRQWNTRGELIVWVNRGQIADLPRAKPRQSFDLVSFGIPVVNA